MTLWEELGFRGNPYDSRALTATEEGERLLVGRARELRELRTQLESSTLHPTVEGDNGVGKTSLVLVAGYMAMQERRLNRTAQILLPMNETLQIGTDADEFEWKALLAIAQCLVSYREFLADCGVEPSGMGDLDRWLNTPIVRGGGGGFGILGVSGSAEVSQATNESTGFADSGLEQIVRRVLLEVFPDHAAGGIVAIIDNMELLGRSNEAKRVLERIRDTTLSLPGVRWVLCGAKGIVRASISSPRLAGRVNVPIELGPVPDEHMEELVDARIDFFAARSTPKAPVGPAGFRHLYELCNRNLRDALKYAQSFALWLDREGATNRPPEDMDGLLEVWLAEEAEAINSAIRLQPRQWTLFDDLAQAGGSCAPGDYEAFGFNSLQRMRTNFVALERAGLIVAEVDEDDHRRRTVMFTSKGWVVHYARSRFESGAHLLSTDAGPRRGSQESEA